MSACRLVEIANAAVHLEAALVAAERRLVEIGAVDDASASPHTLRIIDAAIKNYRAALDDVAAGGEV